MPHRKDDAPGILTHADIESLVERGAVTADHPFEAGQIQPTSLDLRLGRTAHRMCAGFLPHRHAVEDRLQSMRAHRIDLADGAVLERGHIYLIPLLEELRLPKDVSARCNPKSSTGRIDLFTRVITDRNERFDDVAPGYHGRLWLEVMPRSFPVRARTGIRLNQIRFVRGPSALDNAAHRAEHQQTALVTSTRGDSLSQDQLVVDRGFHLTVSLQPSEQSGGGCIGYRAKRFTDIVDLDAIGSHDADRFFEAIRATNDTQLLLEPEEFYIFRSRERLRVPPHLAAEMLAYDVGIGELRTNYAGFFDAGFGFGKDGSERGTPAVLEVRPHDIPFLIDDGQVLFRMEFHRTTRPCTRLYGDANAGSNYAQQDLTLAKYFQPPRP